MIRGTRANFPALYKSSPRRTWRPINILAALLLLGLSFQPNVAYAGGGAGGGGTGGGGSGGHQSSDGYGWYKYSITSGGPGDGFRNGTKWSSIQNTCRGSSDYVYVFVIRGSGGSLAHAMGYNDSNGSAPAWTSNYITAGAFVSRANAKVAFDKAESILGDTGLTWPYGVGWFCAGDNATWSAQPNIRMRVQNSDGSWPDWPAWGTGSANAVAGRQVQWQHQFTVSGNANPPAIQYCATDNTTSGAIKPLADCTAPDKWSQNVGIAGNSTDQTSTTYTTTLADVGKKVCRMTEINPSSMTNSARTSSGELCASVISPAPTPTWTISGYTQVSSATAVPGQQVTFEHHVVNNGPDATGQDIWSDTEVSGGAGVAKPGHSGGQYASGANKTTDTDVITIPPGTPTGTQYCQRVGYQWSAYNNSARGVGPWACVLVAAAPYLSVVGGNTWAGGSVLSPYSGSASIRGSRASSFGSFDEYGVFATSTIDYFGSAGQLGGARTTLGAVNGSRLTFGSRTGTLGSFTDSHQIAGLVSYYAGASHTASVLGGAGNTTVQGNGVYVVSGTGTVSLTAIAANANPHAVIYAPQGTVRIDGPLVYSYAGASTFKDLPSLTVIADTIVVAGSVNQITGNFYATNKFITCNEGPWNSSENATKSSALTTTGACATKLVVNGTVTVANQSATALVLNRSYGGTTTGQPAEMIRMRPEAVLSPYEQNLMFTTIQESELPARY